MKLVTFDAIRSAGITPVQCMDWVVEAISRKRDAQLPPKISLHPIGGESFCNFMPCIADAEYGGIRPGGVKLVTRYPSRVPALDSKLLLFNADSGEMLALMDADWITAMRTGAVAAHSVNLLAKVGFTEVALMGLGNTGRATMLMLADSLGGRDINVRLLRHKGQEETFVERFAGFSNLHFSFVDCYEDLVRGAEVVLSAVTYLAQDICPDEAFGEGVLVVPIHTRGFSNCDLFFDKVFADDVGHVEHFRNFNQFKAFAEVSDVVCGRALGREGEDERILAYNIGISLHDIVFASRIYQMLDLDSLEDINLGQPTDKFWV